MTGETVRRPGHGRAGFSGPGAGSPAQDSAGKGQGDTGTQGEPFGGRGGALGGHPVRDEPVRGRTAPGNART